MIGFTLVHREDPEKRGVAVDRIANWVPIQTEAGGVTYVPQVLIGVLWEDSRKMEYIDTEAVEWNDIPGYTVGEDDEEDPDETTDEEEETEDGEEDDEIEVE
jgi:hypothetical protein